MMNTATNERQFKNKKKINNRCKLFSWIANLLALIGFLYLTWISCSYYLEQKKVTTYEIKSTKLLYFPDIFICPNIPFNPDSLYNLGYSKGIGLSEDLFQDYAKYPRNLTALDVIKTAGWKLGEVVQEVKVGKYRKTFTKNEDINNFWRKDYYLSSPCFVFTPPSVYFEASSLSITFRPKLGLELCSWSENNISSDVTSRCAEILRHCNTNCQWEFTKKNAPNFGINVFLEATTSTTLLQNMADNYMFAAENGQKLILSAYKIFTTDIYCLNNDIYCKQSCLYENSIKTHNCSVLSKKSLKEYITTLCRPLSKFSNFEESFDCKTLNTLRKKTMWSIIHWDVVSKNSFQLIFASNYLVQINNKLSYSFSELLADIGGYFGLFLGQSLYVIIVSFLYLIRKCINCRKFKTAFKLLPKYHFYAIVKISVLLVLIVAAGVNILVIVWQYAKQPVFKIAFISKSNRSHSDVYFTNDLSLYTVFGCITSSTLLLRNCLMTCQGSKQNNYSVETQRQIEVSKYLSNCQTNHFLQRLIYVMPFEDGYSSIKFEVVEYCFSICNKNKSHLGSNYANLYNMPYFKITELKLMCLVSGVIGFYFGVSLQDCLWFTTHKLWRRFSLKKFKHKYLTLSKLCSKLALSILGFGIILHLLYKYVAKSYVHNVTEMKDINKDDSLAMTICFSELETTDNVVPKEIFCVVARSTKVSTISKVLGYTCFTCSSKITNNFSDNSVLMLSYKGNYQNATVKVDLYIHDAAEQPILNLNSSLSLFSVKPIGIDILNWQKNSNFNGESKNNLTQCLKNCLNDLTISVNKSKGFNCDTQCSNSDFYLIYYKINEEEYTSKGQLKITVDLGKSTVLKLFSLHFKASAIFITKIIKLHTPSELISDIGSIGGMTIGFSLLDLLKWFNKVWYYF